MPPKTQTKTATQTSNEEKEISINLFNLCEQR